MSSSQNNVQSRRMRSIGNQLTRRIIHKKIAIKFGFDILLAVLLFFAWFGGMAYAKTGTVKVLLTFPKVSFEMDRSDTGLDNAEHFLKRFESLRMILTDSKTDMIIIDEYISEEIVLMISLIFGLHVLQAVFALMGYGVEDRKTRIILKPINEIAQKADEIARFDFSEDKYHLIEEKITNLSPDEEFKLSSGDSDLMGIESAMNNLLFRIRESNRQQARFVNDASHELRTPIAVIEGYANMLSRWGKEDEKVLDESITAIQNESANMKHLVEQLLFLARGDAGRTMVNKEHISLNALMQEVYEESLMIDENHIYKLQTPVDEVFVEADEGLLKQAIRILVDNAAKYTNTKDEITLSVGYGDNNMAYLQVQDSGIGMKEADVEHMFERFYRADEARSFDGTGLGLSIAKWIVDKHEGHFEILSREELGTRIAIHIPRS